MAKKGKQYSKIAGTWEEVKPSYTDLADVPSTFTPTSHTHGNITNTGEITASATIATGDHLVIADNSSGNDLTTSTITFDTTNTTTFLRKDGTWATPPAANGLNFVNTISLTTAKTGTDLYNAGLDGEGDYLIVNGGGDITNAGTPLITLAVQTPGDEGDSTLPVTLETGDWILFKSFDSENNILEVILMNNNDATKAAAVHTHTIANVTGLQTALDGKVAKAGDTMTGTLVIGQVDSGNPGAGDNNLRVSGYGILGNRGSLYVTNQNTSGDIQFGVGGVHAAATKMKISSNGVVDIGGNTVFHDGYHPNADTWTTARTLTIGNTGKSVDGSGNVSWSLAELGAYAATNPNGYTSNVGDITGVTAGNGLSGGGTSGTVTLNVGAGTGISVAADSIAIANGYSPNTAIELTSSQNLNDITTAGFYYQTANADTSGNNYPSGEAGSLLVQKSAGLVTQTYTTYSTDPKVYVRTYYTSWSGWVRVFTDNYHPNADKWTTARTITLGGDLTGSVSLDGSANVTLNAEVTNGSHTHDDRYYTESESDGRFIIKNSGYEWTGTGGSALSFRSLDTIDTASGDQAALEVYQDTAGADAFMQFHIGGDYAKYFGLHGGINDFVVGGWSHGASYQRIYHDGYRPYADSAGSAGNADTVDGFHASQTAGSANTAVVRNSSGYIMNTWFNSSRSNETSAAASYIYDTGDGYMRKKTLANAQAEIVTSSAVTSALGYTPYNSTNPSGYTTNTGTVTSVATGGGLTGGTITTSGTISHADTSSQASVNNSGNTFIQDITLDTYGHITAITSATANNVGNADTVDGYHAVAFVRNVYSEFLDDAFPAAPLTTSFTSWSKPTGMPSVTLEANSRYYVFAAGSYYTGATTTGIGISPTFSTVSGQIRGGQIWINTSTSTTAGTSEFTANWRTMSTSGGVTGNFALGTAGPTTIPGNEFGFYGIVETSGTSTVLSMHIRSEVNGSNVYVNRLALTAMKLPT